MNTVPNESHKKASKEINYGMDTPYGYLYKPLNHWAQIGVLFAAFAACPLLGTVVGKMVGDLSEIAETILIISYIAIFFAGYGLWAARLQAIAFETLGKSIFKTLFMLIVRRQKPTSINDVMPSQDKLLEMAVKAQKAGASFAAVSWFVGIIAGVVSMLFESSFGVMAMFLFVSVSCVIWGYVLAALGRRGWLPIMEEG